MSDKAILRKQQQWAKADKQELDDFVKAALSHRAGRRYLLWLLSVGRAIGENAFTGNALTTSFQCGEQNVGQQIMAHVLEVAPDGFLAMLKEHQDEQRERNAAVADRRDNDRDWDDADRPADGPNAAVYDDYGTN